MQSFFFTFPISSNLNLNFVEVKAMDIDAAIARINRQIADDNTSLFQHTWSNVYEEHEFSGIRKKVGYVPYGPPLHTTSDG